jgi:hypothetical protein
MMSLRGVRWACALMLTAAGAGPTQAAWNNVFQVCCASCNGGGGAISGYAAAAAPNGGCCAPACCPEPCCTTQYVQRSYYVPVTCYTTKTYYEPVTTYRTSYYYEPVTTYRYSCHYDPCTCSYQQVACPTTCYRMRSQCCPVTSYVQRCCRVPVTTYRQSCYWEPVTTCAPPPCCAPTCCNGNGNGKGNGHAAVPATVAPAVPAVPAAPAAPTITEQSDQTQTYSTPAPPTVQEQRQVPVPMGNGMSNRGIRYLPPAVQPSRPTESNSFRPTTPRAPAPVVRPPVVKLDRIVSAPANNGLVRGQVVSHSQAPRAGAQVLFVSVQRQAPQQTVTAGNDGQFRVQLASGSWLVYVQGVDGKPVFHSRIEVQNDNDQLVKLVSR